MAISIILPEKVDYILYQYGLVYAVMVEIFWEAWRNIVVEMGAAEGLKPAKSMRIDTKMCSYMQLSSSKST